MGNTFGVRQTLSQTQTDRALLVLTERLEAKREDCVFFFDDVTALYYAVRSVTLRTLTTCTHANTQ